MEFRAGLAVIPRAGVPAVLAEAARQGLPAFVLATRGCVDRESFFHAVRETLPLDPPLVSSRSWDALSDSLWEGLRGVNSARIVIVWPDVTMPDFGVEGDFRLALSVLQDVAESLTDPGATSGRPKEVSVYVAAGSEA